VEWFDEARAAKDIPNPNAMCLSTVAGDGQASSRMVLCKEIFAEDGAVVFYTNYDSRKASELAGNPRCALLFHWDHPGQAGPDRGAGDEGPRRDERRVLREPALGEPPGRARERAEPPDRQPAELVEKVMMKAVELDLDLSKVIDGDGRDLEIPRPANWGGYMVHATGVELWCDGVGACTSGRGGTAT
jgi:pyridoxamine 5'-phosphate oxidase